MKLKQYLKAIIGASLLLFTVNFSQAQTRIGYLNFQALLGQMPEVTTVRSQIDVYQKQFADQLSEMNTDLQAKNTAFYAELTKVNDAVRASRLAELQDQQKRLRAFQASAQSKVEAKTNELIGPVAERARALIRAVAKEKGYRYVFDTSSGPALAVSPTGDDLMEAVKTRLKVK